MQTPLSLNTLLSRMADLFHLRQSVPSTPQTGDSSLDRFVYHFFDTLHFFETVDPYSTSGDPRKPYFDRIDRFLQKYTNLSYQELRTRASVHDLSEEDYRLAFGAIKGRLFDFRARLYLVALDACDQEGITIPELLPKVRSAVIPPIKKEAREPTFEILFEYLSA